MINTEHVHALVNHDVLHNISSAL